MNTPRSIRSQDEEPRAATAVGAPNATAGRVSLRRAFASVAGSNLLGAGLGFLANVLLARTLALGDFGRMSLVLSIIMIFYTVADCGFSNAVVILHNRRGGGSGLAAVHLANRAYARVLVWAAAVSLVVIAVLAPSYDLSALEVAAVVLSFALFAAYRYMTALHQAVADWRRFGLLTVLNNVAKIGCLAAAIILLGRVASVATPYAAALLGYIAYSVVIFAAAVWTSRGLLGLGEPPGAEARREFRDIVVPIGLAGVLIILTMRCDALVIERFLGPEQLGIYAAANTLALVFPLITGSLMNVFLRESAEGKSAVLRRILGAQRRYALALVAVFAVAALLSKAVIMLLFGARFAAAADVFRILLVAYVGGVYFTPLESYFYANHPRTILWMRLVQLLVVTAGSVALVQWLGLHGVALAIVASRCIAWVYFSIASRKVLAAEAVHAGVH